MILGRFRALYLDLCEIGAGVVSWALNSSQFAGHLGPMGSQELCEELSLAALLWPC